MNKVTLYNQIERNTIKTHNCLNKNCIKHKNHRMLRKRRKLTGFCLYFHVPNTSFNKSQHDFNSNNNFNYVIRFQNQDDIY